MSLIFPVGGKREERRKVDATRALLWPSLIDHEKVGQFQTPTEKAVVSTASVRMAKGDANATGRRILALTNTGDGVALISGTNAGGGARLLPGQSMRYAFAEISDGTLADVSVWARAETIGTTILIEEY